MKPTLILLFAALAHASSAFANVNPHPVVPPMGVVHHDLTDSFERLLSLESPNGSYSLTAAQKAKIHSYSYLFVPGFVVQRANGTGGYFKNEMAFLKSAGLVEGVDFLKLGRAQGFDGANTMEANAASIQKGMMSLKGPVIIVTHSKGTPDVLYWATLAPTSVRNRIVGWVAMQSATWGSPIADSVTESPLGRKAMNQFLTILGGSPESLVGLRQDKSREFMAEHLDFFSTWISTIPTVAMAAVEESDDVSPGLKIIDKLYGDRLREQADGWNDGMIPVPNATIPSADYVIHEGMDHFGHPRNRSVFAPLLLLILGY